MATPKSGKSCVEDVRHSLVTVAENSRSATFTNVKGTKIRRIRVDGCLLKGVTASDWIVSKENCLDLVVELKGCDVDHAMRQVIATLRFWCNHELKGGTRLAALVVCTKYPRVDTKIQRAKIQLAKEFNAPLHVRTRNETYNLCTLVHYSGKTI